MEPIVDIFVAIAIVILTFIVVVAISNSKNS